MNEKTKEVQDQLAKNLGKVFAGINGTGHKDFPQPVGEATEVPSTKSKSLLGNRGNSKSDGAFMVPYYLSTPR